MWLLLLVCLVVAVPPILIRISKPDVTDLDEAMTLTTSIQTWQRRHAHADTIGVFEQMVPYRNNRALYGTPPASTWLQQFVFWIYPLENVQPVAPSVDETQALVLRGRLLAAMMALITVVAVFWAGYSIGGTKTAVFATLICIANPIFIYHARVASNAMLHSGWAMMSIAAALWAIRPLRPTPSVERQFIGWVTCGLMFGLAMLTSGFITIGTVAAPILLILIMCPHRISHLLGLLAALLIALLMCLPWAIYAYDNDANVTTIWFNQMIPAEPVTLEAMWGQATARGIVLLIALAPWTLWLIGAIVQPFSTAQSSSTRMRLFIGLGWLAFVSLLLLTAPRTGQLKDLLPALPVFAVAVGQLFSYYDNRAAEGRFIRFWRFLRWPQLAIVMFLSITVPICLYRQELLIEQGWIDQVISRNIGLTLAIALGSVMLILSALSMRWAMKHFPGRALACWSFWTVAMLTVIAIPLTESPITQNASRGYAKQITDIIGGRNLFWLQRPSIDPEEPDAALQLYTGRIMPPIAPKQIDQAMDEHQEFYVLGRSSADIPATTRVLVKNFEEVRLSLWKYQRTVAAPPPPEVKPPKVTAP